MSDDKKLPALTDGRAVVQHLDGTRRALETRDPITGFFHGVGSRAATRALDHYTKEVEATARNIRAQSDCVRAMLELRDVLDAYQARDELAAAYYADTVVHQRDNLREQAHQRELAARRRQLELIDADRFVFNAEQGFSKQREERALNEERWLSEARTRTIESKVRLEEWEASLSEPAEISAPKSSWAEQQLGTLYAALNEAIADGKDPSAIRDAIDALERLKGRM